MKIDDELILKLENLAKLSIDLPERERLKGELENVITMFDAISNAPVDDKDPLVHFEDITTELRDDDPLPPDDSRRLLEVSQHRAGNYITVPKVIKQ